eukprot:6197949-Pleurochrysis_carterae.AAC.2
MGVLLISAPGSASNRSSSKEQLCFPEKSISKMKEREEQGVCGLGRDRGTFNSPQQPSRPAQLGRGDLARASANDAMPSAARL